MIGFRIDLRYGLFPHERERFPDTRPVEAIDNVEKDVLVNVGLPKLRAFRQHIAFAMRVEFGVAWEHAMGEFVVAGHVIITSISCKQAPKEPIRQRFVHIGL